MQTARREAWRDFGGRGPALAQHFLHHVKASPGNTAFFFLFSTVGDANTAQQLIQALLNPPLPQGMALGRDPAELGIAIEAVLKNETVRTSPTVLRALTETVKNARQQLGGTRVAEVAISLLGKCRTPEAERQLQQLATDSDRAIRAAAVEALANTLSFEAGQTVQGTLAGDVDPDIRARAAASLARSQSPEAIASLQAALLRETDPLVIDETVRSLTNLRALPQDPMACLEAANRVWDASAAQPLFDCWRATANREDLITQATVGGWTVRAFALHALAEIPRSLDQRIVPLVARPPAPIPRPASSSNRAGTGMAVNPPSAAIPTPSFEQATRDRLLQSCVDILSQNISGLPAPNSLSYSTAQLVRDAFWEISGRNMVVALAFADRIVPMLGRYTSIGRFGESYDLHSRDGPAYASRRRPWQLLAAGLAGLLISALLMLKRLRKIAVAMLASLCMWALWSAFQTDVRELPPPPLFFLTVSCLAFLSAGLVAGAFALMPVRGWVKVTAGAVVAGACAFLVCGFTRWTSLFPIGAEGWELIFDPFGSALLAVPAALVLSLGLIRWKY
ncbi:MAG: HEAT repeat domain-containing protein [Acidobacteriia bacterium]|nr:HEAT repeat domain-containing protein [Terriglobia bacterium]